MKREVKVIPAYDRRDPNPAKNYGIGSAILSFVLSGDHGAVQLTVMPGWMLPEVMEANQDVFPYKTPHKVIGIHSPKPMFEYQRASLEYCEYVKGPCYTSDSYAAGELAYNILISEGHEGLWKFLEEYYVGVFGGLE